ncbi:hypothetical protein HY483_03095 [Candidatus Woesearchaeota archaeon]|nr:hypothetical protein [Candidatus Woesearchaeota archaeon]
MGNKYSLGNAGSSECIDSFLNLGKEDMLKVFITSLWPSTSHVGTLDIIEGVDGLIVNVYSSEAEASLGVIPFVEQSEVIYRGIPSNSRAFGECCSSLLGFLDTVEGGARKNMLIHKARSELLVYCGKIPTEDFDRSYFSRIAGILVDDFPGLSILQLDNPTRQHSADYILEELRRTKNFSPRVTITPEIARWLGILERAELEQTVIGTGLLLNNVEVLRSFEQAVAGCSMPLFSLRGQYQTGDVESARFAEDLRMNASLY